jgi:hypothetical protein
VSATVFRRTSKATDEVVEAPEKGPGAKGRPTPTRREAEAAARERSRTTLDKKTADKVQRSRRNEQNARVREAMRTGDERYLPARDKGPVKRFVRNFIDSRITVVEFLLPVLLIIWIMQATGNSAFVKISTALWTTTILVVAVDTIWLLVRIRRAIRRELPEESMTGITTYTLMRVVQIRPLRQPKAQVRVGGRPK